MSTSPTDAEIPAESPPARTSWARAWGPALLFASAIFVASSIPAPTLPKTLLFPGQDKVVHALEYAVLGYLLARALHLRAQSGPRLAVRLATVIAGTALGLLYGISDELHQSFVPGRAVELADLAADLTGALLGSLTYRLLCNWQLGGRGSR